MSHLKLHFALRTSHCSLHTPHSTLHTPHFTLHTAHSKLHTSHFTLHSPYFTLHTSPCTLHAPHFTLHSSHSTLHLISSQPSCSHSNTIYEIQLQKTIVLRMQPQHEATLTQPLQCDLQWLSCKTQKNYAQRRRKLQLQNRISTPKRKKDDFEALFKGILKGKSLAPKWRKSANKSIAQPIYSDWVAKHNRTTRNGIGNGSSKTGWISTPKRKIDDFEALFKGIF